MAQSRVPSPGANPAVCLGSVGLRPETDVGAHSAGAWARCRHCPTPMVSDAARGGSVPTLVVVGAAAARREFKAGAPVRKPPGVPAVLEHPWDAARRAERLADELLAGVGTRLAHTRRVAERTRSASGIAPAPWRAAVALAGWVHDIGYAPALVETGFHPLDGARYLRASGWPEEVCRLVAFHTGAATEAALRWPAGGMSKDFDPPPSAALDVLTWADLTSSPTGEACSAAERIEEILRRYERGSVVHRAVLQSREEFLEAAGRVEAALAELRRSAAAPRDPGHLGSGAAGPGACPGAPTR